MSKDHVTASYELTLTVSRVKQEHAVYMLRLLRLFSEAFGMDGQDVEVHLSAELGRDGVERLYELLPAEEFV